ncbi:hypothetical protein TSUD_365640 [Trifolium subterraneum]|uniref:Splicing factor 3B subunit 1 domain-containing protein n=1 Tax=Trifolium subterraneum TaxID=3900 RepID=A0A2Z6MPP9_TRISU|nr:hypothetical protein TSUD_365640 [Trifolium subterraneum]
MIQEHFMNGNNAKELSAIEKKVVKLLKKVMNVVYKVKDLIRRPHVPSIVVIRPLLISEDYYLRLEGRDIISNLSNVAGLYCIIATLRPGIHDVDENIRNTTARACSCVAYALGVPRLLPFLKTVCQCQESWQTRHTGIKIDENDKVKTIIALALTALAKATIPYGIDSFNVLLKPPWAGITQESGKVLAAFLKAMGFIIPLMEPLDASDYTNKVMPILIREFQSPDEEVKKNILKVVKQCVSTDGVESDYIRKNLVPEFVDNFLDMGTLDERSYKEFVETTIEIANKIGVDNIANRIVESRR